MSNAAPSELQLEESISVEDFYEQISQENNLLILDVREKDEYDAWQIETRFTPQTIHIPYFEFFEDQDEQVAKVPQGKDVITVCAIGDASDFVAAVLEEHGYRAMNLTGGMIAWGHYYATRPVAETSDYQIYQIERVARGCLSHVLISDGKAILIDPLRHIEQYETFLTAHDASLALILDTHAHADHISGGFDLQANSGAPYYMHPYDAIHPFDMLPAKKPFHMMEDGQIFEVGQLKVEVIHTPGHTLGQVNFLVTAPDGRHYLFSGDNIFIESFGRPDLGGQGEGWAPVVYETIFERIMNQVPGDALVLPGHYARVDEANEDGTFTRTLDTLWRKNQGLQHADREEFIGYVLTHLPKMPLEYIEIKRVNIGLSEPCEDEMNKLELGKNICALSDAY